MDYSLCQSLHYNMKGISRVVIMYDIVCQYYRNLRRRFEWSEFLEMPGNLEILRAIGLFHVHGHQSFCLPRYSPVFIEGLGWVDGEILETLWSIINLVAGSTRAMSRAHRAEVLDAHMNYSNWRKLLGIGTSRDAPVVPLMLMHFSRCIALTLKRKYAAAKVGFENSEEAFTELDESTDESRRAKWQKAEARAHRKRDEDPTSMDIYEVVGTKGMRSCAVAVRYLTSRLRSTRQE